MKIETSELTGAALDWAVDIIENPEALRFGVADWLDQRRHTVKRGELVSRWSSSWAQGGPIIEREVTKIFHNVGGTWSAMILKDIPLTPDERGTSLALSRRGQWNGAGPTPLSAAMRCYVVSKLGDEVEVPDEIKSWHERTVPHPTAYDKMQACLAEITELRAALAERDAEIERMGRQILSDSDAFMAQQRELASLRAAAQQGLDALNSASSAVAKSYAREYYDEHVADIATLTAALENKHE